jgi:5'-nucleotidase / UDP-sugar diphosphatase
MSLILTSLFASLLMPGSQQPAGTEVTFSILQLNDVYEITPTSGEGGMARVATVYKTLKQREPNSFVVIAGDFLSPSALGTAKVNGERLAGKQMVAALNMIPVTIATFGNHEFDPSYELFKKRMAESKFAYVSSNVLDANKKPFPGVQESIVKTISTSAGDVRIGFLGLTIPSNPKDYVSYADVMDSAKKQVEALRPNVDVLIAITHLAYEDDMKISKEFPQIDMIIGGHEHERHRIEIGSLPGIYKADANARTVFIHDFAYAPSTHRLHTTSTLKEVTSEVPEDPAVKAEVDKWVAIAYDGFRKEGFEPTNKVADITEPLDGKEESVRNQGTRLTQLIAEGMLAAAPGTEIAIFNGGSIRIDDVILPGPLTEYDVIRILPFGGPIWSVDMKGELLKRVLEQGLANRGNGGYLQTVNISIGADGGWQVNGKALDIAAKYRVAINDFLLTGNEQNLSFLKRDNPDITVIAEHRDIRSTTIAQLKKNK